MPPKTVITLDLRDFRYETSEDITYGIARKLTEAGESWAAMALRQVACRSEKFNEVRKVVNGP